MTRTCQMRLAINSSHVESKFCFFNKDILYCYLKRDELWLLFTHIKHLGKCVFVSSPFLFAMSSFILCRF